MNDDNVIDLLVYGLTQKEMSSLRPSLKRQKRLCYLLAQNKADSLSKEEEIELNACSQLEHAMQLIKARKLHQVLK